MAKAPLHKDCGAKLRAVNVFALPNGGFEVRDPYFGRGDEDDELMSHRGQIHRSPAVAAFTTLAEALVWLSKNMAQPATETKGQS